jgi:RNA polymerase primary sigma factor
MSTDGSDQDERPPREYQPEIGWWDEETGTYAESGTDEVDSLQLYLWEISRASFLPYWEEQSLFERLAAGDRGARDQLIVAHLRMVPRIARRYANHGLPFQDLIQEGNLSLHRAIRNFDYRQGNRLSSYATWVIASTIERAIANTSRTIRVPVHVQRKLALIRRAEKQLSDELLRQPTSEELAEVTVYEPEEIDWLKQRTLPPLSLNVTIGDDEEQELEQLIPDRSTPSPEERFIEEETASDLSTALASLDDRERNVVEARCGWKRERKTLEEIGWELGLSRERVRQIEAGGLAKLRRLLAKVFAESSANAES